MTKFPFSKKRGYTFVNHIFIKSYFPLSTTLVKMTIPEYTDLITLFGDYYLD
jgi:hypothetical protein